MATLEKHFPKRGDDVSTWEPMVLFRALAPRVLVVARTRIEGAWCAYVDAVPGQRHRDELEPVLDYGAKVDEAIARELFPVFAEIPYAE